MHFLRLYFLLLPSTSYSVLYSVLSALISLRNTLSKTPAHSMAWLCCLRASAMHLPWIFLSGLCLPPQDQIPPEEMRHTDIQVLGNGKCALRTLENTASSQAGTRSQTLPFLNRGGPAEVITILPRHSPAPRWHTQEIKPQEAIEYGLFLCFYVPSTFISCHFL